MTKHKAVMLAAALLASTAAYPQGTVPGVPGVAPGQQPGYAQDYQQMMVAMQSAQAAAQRPGDESLDCDAIVSEINAGIEHPAYQAYMAEAAAAAQRELALMQNPQAAPVQTPAQAQLAAQQAVAAQQAQTERLIAVMPLMMRMQRLAELATLKACDWNPPEYLPDMSAGP